MSFVISTGSPSFEEDESFYVDYGETGPYEVDIGESECAT